MKPIQSRLLKTLAVFFALSVASASLAEARIGGGRSSGFRGSRGFGTRAVPTSPYRQGTPQQPQQNYGNQTTRPPGLFGNSGASSGGFMRGMLGGLAGGMIGSMLFRSLGFAGGPGALGGGGGFGLMELLLLFGVGYLLYRWVAGRKSEKRASVEPGPFASPMSPSSMSSPSPRTAPSDELTQASILAKYNAEFDLVSFREERMDEFVKLQAAWNQRDLSSVSEMIGPELRQELDADIAQLRISRRINRIENIAVRSAEVIEAWQQYGKEFATLRFRANLLDYTVDETTSELVAGDQSQPVKFEEDWTFVRSMDDPAAARWKLTAIEA